MPRVSRGGIKNQARGVAAGYRVSRGTSSALFGISQHSLTTRLSDGGQSDSMRINLVMLEDTSKVETTRETLSLAGFTPTDQAGDTGGTGGDLTLVPYQMLPSDVVQALQQGYAAGLYGNEEKGSLASTPWQQLTPAQMQALQQAQARAWEEEDTKKASSKITYVLSKWTGRGGARED